MREIIHDLLYCLKLSVLIALIPFGLGVIGALIAAMVKGNFDIVYILNWGRYVLTWAACFGLFISAIAFVRADMMDPLNYEETWKTYFYKFHLVGVIFFISMFMLTYTVILDIILRKI